MREREGLSGLTAGIRAALLYVGTIIGAGFASGKELLTFFEGNNFQVYLSITVAGILFYLTGLVCMNIGRHTSSDNLFKISHSLFKTYGLILNVFIASCYFILIGGMLAGTDALVYQSVGYNGFPIASIVMLIAALLIVSYGINGLKNITSVLVPCIVAVLIIVCALTLSQNNNSVISYQSAASQLPVSVVYCVLYVAFNILLSAAVLSSVGKTLKPKQINIACLVAALIITIVMVLLITALRLNPEIHSVDLPVIVLAENISSLLSIITSIVILIAIFITLASSLYPLIQFLRSCFDKDIYIYVGTGLIALVLSRVGFSSIIKYLYPLQGVVGVIFITMCSIRLNRKKNGKNVLLHKID